jgi:hypothetical protein
MPRTSENVLVEQRRVADADLRQQLATKGPMPAGLSPLQQTQFRLWGWWDARGRDKPSKYKFKEHRSGAAARVVPPVTPNRISANCQSEEITHDRRSER